MPVGPESVADPCLAKIKTAVGWRRLLRLTCSTCRLLPLAICARQPAWLYGWLYSPTARSWHDQHVDLADLQLNLRHLLNQWDPIGVAEIAPDEYDCMLGPLLTRLGAGAGRSEISEFLWHELEDHFGLDPTHHEVDSVADRLVAWWAAAQPTS
jgi:hypothetical protein